MESLRIPLFSTPKQRQFSNSEDQWFKNAMPEIIEGQKEDTNTTYVVKRPGLEQTYDTTYVAAGRGCYGWSETGAVYSIVGDRIYKNASEITSGGSRLTNSSGRVHFTEVKGGTPRLVIQDGDTMWTVTSSDTVAEVTAIDLPSDQVPGVANLNGYVFVMNSAGVISHSDVNNPASWDSANTISASGDPDDGVAITRHLNYVIAFGEWSTQFFFDAGNATGSVLGPVDGSNLRMGCANGETVWAGENTVIWVAQSRAGGVSVMALEGNKLQMLSTKPVERFIQEEQNSGGNGLADAYAYGLKIAGHQFYVLTLPNSEHTLVCDFRDGTWHEWTTDDGTETYFTGVDCTSVGKQHYFLDEDNGKIYRMDVDLYQDYGNDINFEILTNRIDFLSTKPKFLHRMTLIGDTTDSSSNMTIDWSDDDYNTYKTARTVDLNSANPKLTGLGTFKRRAFRLKHTGNVPVRLEALEMGVDQGTYAG